MNFILSIQTSNPCDDLQIGFYDQNGTYIQELLYINSTINFTISSAKQNRIISYLKQYYLEELESGKNYLLKIFLYEDWAKQVETLYVPSTQFQYKIYNQTSLKIELVSNHSFLYEFYETYRQQQNKLEEERQKNLKLNQQNQTQIANQSQKSQQNQTQNQNANQNLTNQSQDANKTEQIIQLEMQIQQAKSKFEKIFANDLKLYRTAKYIPVYHQFFIVSMFDYYNQKLIQQMQNKFNQDSYFSKYELCIFLLKTFSLMAKSQSNQSQATDKQEFFLTLLGRFSYLMPQIISTNDKKAQDNYQYVNNSLKLPLYQEFYNNFYSYNVANIHFININLEYYEQNLYQKEKILNWLESDLRDVSTREEKSQRPWIIVHSSTLFYCSFNMQQCQSNNQLEELFFQYKVDLVIYSGLAVYERYLPLYLGEIEDIDNKELYYSKVKDDEYHQFILNPQAPVYILEGGGSVDIHYQFFKKIEEVKGLVTRIHKEGFGILTARNNSHLLYEHYFIDDINQPADAFFIIKDNANLELPSIMKANFRLYNNKEFFFDFKEYYKEVENNRSILLQQKKVENEKQIKEQQYEKILEKDALNIYLGYDFDKAQLHGGKKESDDYIQKENQKHFMLLILSFILYFSVQCICIKWKDFIRAQKIKYGKHCIYFQQNQNLRKQSD